MTRRRSSRRSRRAWLAVAVLVALVIAARLLTAGPVTAPDPTIPTTETIAPTSETAPASTSPPLTEGPLIIPSTEAPNSPQTPDARAQLAALQINDARYAGPPYNRELFPTWKDPDGNGCDAREDALIAASLTPLSCVKGKVSGTGRWPLVYVAGETSLASDLDADHVVPLGNAWPSGAWAWTTDQRTHYANDPAVLWAVDDGANQSKGDKDPSRWRPAVHDVWCAYASRWTTIKVSYGLTATTPERDALGQMLEEC